jgi:hypothetical protein
MSDEIRIKKVDEDWKKRAQQEKELDAQKVGDRPTPGAEGTPAKAEPKPHPLFPSLVESLASQALMFMGAMRDPMTGASHADPRQAQTMIEMLQMLEAKTQGNLAKEELEMFKQVMNEIRMTFVQLTQPQAPRGGPKGPRPLP